VQRSGPMPQRFTKPPLRIGDNGDGTPAKPAIVGRHATANTICAMTACTRTLRFAQSPFVSSVQVPQSRITRARAELRGRIL
jgi:hypothetical protein